jgi:hypothetical protein
MTESPGSSTRSPAPPIPSRGWRWVISGLLLFHITAVFIAPFAFATSNGPGQASPLAVTVMSLLQPYIDAAFLNHGYFFFAPNPGPAHLVRYRLEFADGREPVERMFPDLKRHWPRLLYHRHFMLAESLNGRFVPPEPPEEIRRDPMRLAGWRMGREQYEGLLRSYARHLQQQYGASSVTLTRVEHRLPTTYEVMEQGMRLDDPSLYLDLPEDISTGAPR